MELFPKYQIAFSFGKRKEHFTNVNAVKDSRMQTNENENSRGTQRICDLKNIESSFNKQCTCFCFTDHTLDDFINYCCYIDKTYEKFREMKNRYKLKDKGTIIIA